MTTEIAALNNLESERSAFRDIANEGCSERNLRDFRAFYVAFPDCEIWHTRVPNLDWSHFRLIMRVADPTAREWYINEASNEHWVLDIA